MIIVITAVLVFNTDREQLITHLLAIVVKIELVQQYLATLEM